MFSEMPRPVIRSGAWRISLFGTLAFAIGSLAVFIFLDRFIANDIQRRNDAWLWGEVSLLGDMAERTPRDTLYSQIVGDIAEIVRKEVPNRTLSQRNAKDKVFFLQEGENRTLRLWIGAGAGESIFAALKKSRVRPDQPLDLHVDGNPVPFRVVSIRIEDGSRIYLGLLEEDQLRVLDQLRFCFGLLWMVIVLFGFALMFSISRGLLRHVQKITDAASRIGRSDLGARVPTTDRADEVAHLALTLNRMLDRIESSMHQLHTMTDSLAHDIRSPITAVRGKLEASLTAASTEQRTESVVASIEDLDRLSQFLTDALDVAEGKADALRLARTEIDLEETLLSMIDLYEPSMAEKHMSVEFHRSGPVKISADAGLIHRMISNLFDNEITHLPPGCMVTIRLQVTDSVRLTIEDNGPGFPAEIIQELFELRARGRESNGYGLGLAFVDAVVRAHGGSVAASNVACGGACITIDFPVRSDIPLVEARAEGVPK
jgi:signal transduction histidine kinase